MFPFTPFEIGRLAFWKWAQAGGNVQAGGMQDQTLPPPPPDMNQVGGNQGLDLGGGQNEPPVAQQDAVQQGDQAEGQEGGQPQESAGVRPPISLGEYIGGVTGVPPVPEPKPGKPPRPPVSVFPSDYDELAEMYLTGSYDAYFERLEELIRQQMEEMRAENPYTYLGYDMISKEMIDAYNQMMAAMEAQYGKLLNEDRYYQMLNEYSKRMAELYAKLMEEQMRYYKEMMKDYALKNIYFGHDMTPEQIQAAEEAISKLEQQIESDVPKPPFGGISPPRQEPPKKEEGSSVDVSKIEDLLPPRWPPETDQFGNPWPGVYGEAEKRNL